MKLQELFEASDPNAYYEVVKSFDSEHITGPKQYKKVTLKPGDQIHHLHGGVFHVRDGEGDFLQLFHIFDRSQGDYHSYRNDPTGYTVKELGDLEKEGKIKEIPASERQKAKYNT